MKIIQKNEGEEITSNLGFATLSQVCNFAFIGSNRRVGLMNCIVLSVGPWPKKLHVYYNGTKIIYHPQQHRVEATQDIDALVFLMMVSDHCN